MPTDRVEPECLYTPRRLLLIEGWYEYLYVYTFSNLDLDFFYPFSFFVQLYAPAMLVSMF